LTASPLGPILALAWTKTCPGPKAMPPICFRRKASIELLEAEIERIKAHCDKVSAHRLAADALFKPRSE
jgi:hypothetical protein